MKLIKFASVLEVIDMPKPSIKHIPEWYKKTKTIANAGVASVYDEVTFKRCIPFVDSMTSGYIIELWSDIEIKIINGNYEIFWKDKEFNPMSFKTDNSIGLMPVPVGYSNKVFSFNHHLYIKTPKNYSLLFTQPLNRFDLPFYAMSGIVDTDIEPMFPGGYPLFIKEGFEGVIEKGTPILQVIPIKRDSWKSVRSKKTQNEGRLTFQKAGLYISSWYKKNAWSKKKYE